MRKNRTPGSARGVPGNRHSYRRDKDEREPPLPRVTGELSGGNMRGDRSENTRQYADNTNDTWLEVLFLRQ